jgi:hypothetical protein
LDPPARVGSRIRSKLGEKLLWRWLDHRRNQQMDIEFYRALQDVAARIAELCALLTLADAVLSETLEGPLTANDLLAGVGGTNVAAGVRADQGESP